MKTAVFNGRAGEIRTHDLLHPMQARYQATLRPADQTEAVNQRPGPILGKGNLRDTRNPPLLQGRGFEGPFRHSSQRSRSFRPPTKERSLLDVRAIAD